MSLPTLEAVAARLRELTPQVVGVIARRYRDFAAAEDAVQEALLAAMTQWPREGEPDNPRGWLIQVASRRLTDVIRAESARRRREARVLREMPDDERVAPSPDVEGPRDDDSLVLLFMCCHPALPRSSAVALTLRAFGGLTTAQIARAYLVPEATMAQRISRAKQRLKASGAVFAIPEGQDRNERLSAVLHVLYLIFNEGYATSAGDLLMRSDLSTEAIRLTREVRRLVPDHAEVAGLLALMILTDARRDARSGPRGELVPLPEQDRGRWDQRAIAEGVALISETLPRGAVGPYQLQAAIAAVHDEAARAEDTDWPQILALYGLLVRMSDNPMVALNHAVALAMVDGAAAGLEAVRALEADARLTGHYRIDAVRAHLYEMAGDMSTAARHYRAAAERTPSLPERHYLTSRGSYLFSTDRPPSVPGVRRANARGTPGTEGA